MNPLARLKRSVSERGLAGTLLHAPRAALRPVALRVRTRRSAAQAPHLVASASAALLHLGSGPERIPGWINVDLYFPAELCLDLTRPLPLPTGSVDAIYSQHFLEHIPRDAGARLIAECARVLKPGGWLRISTPDLERHVELYRAGRLDAAAVNDIMRAHDHLFIYDYATLAGLFAETGLADVQRAEPQESRCEHLRGLDSRTAGEGEGTDLIVEGKMGQTPFSDV